MPTNAKILVVDDSELNREVMIGMLEPEGYEVLAAADGREGIELAAAHSPDVILLDVKMPGLDGYQTCSELQAMAETASIPIIFVTANFTEEADQVHGLDLGGYDYLVKPVPRGVLLARVGVMVRIRRSDQRIRRLSMIDDFTGLYSKTYVLHRMGEEMNRARRDGSDLVISMIDLDDFKRCNDTYGHLFGDEVLKRVAEVLRSNVRSYDSVGRYGGEEFLLLQPNMDEGEAAERVDAVRKRLQDEIFRPGGVDVRVNFSSGLAVWDHMLPAEELIHRADTALYAAKHGGKGQTKRFTDLDATAVAETLGS